MTTLRWCSQALIAVTVLSFMVMVWSSNWSPFTTITSLHKASQDQRFSAQKDGSINRSPPIADINARPSSSPDSRGDDLSSGYGAPSTIADVKAPPSSSTSESHGDDPSFGYGASSSSANDLALPSSSSESHGDYLREHAGEPSPSPSPPSPDLGGNPYHNWQSFRADFSHMLKRFRVFIYPHAYNPLSPFANAFLPNPNPTNPKLGNYFSEHIFKISLLNSSLITREASQAHFFFLPFSINALRNDPRMREEDRIAAFVASYVQNVSRDFEFWNRTSGADHFYACCHSVGRTAASQTPSLQRNAVQVVCSSNYFLTGYAAHKDIAMPQVWPRSRQLKIRPPQKRTRLAFYAGRTQNSEVRQRLVGLWKNDTDLDIYAGKVTGSYEEAFQRTKFCLHVKGYEVNTARIADAIHYGCVPVIISNHYDLPFANVLDWKKFSIIISHADLSSLKSILMSVTEQHYIALFENVCKVRKHFQWQDRPSGYDAFHMTMYQLWLRRGFVSPLQNSLDSKLF